MEKKKSFAIGYSLVIHSIIMYILCSFVIGLSANFVVPQAAGNLGCGTDILYTINMIASLVGVVATFLLAQWCLKKGVRIVTIISLIISAIGVILAGYATNMVVYVIGVILMFAFAQGYGFVVTNTLMANWFPRKKAEILGITTTGTYLANIIFTPIFSGMLAKGLKLKSPMLVLAIIMAVMAILSIFWIKERPEAMGLFPDNKEEGIEQLRAMQEAAKNYKSKWTVKKLLKTPIVWFFVIAFGFLLLQSSGMPAQLVPLMFSRGIANAPTVMMYSAAFGFVGSIVTGFIDKKIGTRMTTVLMCIVFIISLVVLATVMNPTVTICMICLNTFFSGGCFNMCPSLAISIFGAREYNAVNRVIHPLTQVIKSFSFVAISLGGKFGNASSGVMWMFLIAVVLCLIFVLPIVPKNLKEAPSADIPQAAPAEAAPQDETKTEE